MRRAIAGLLVWLALALPVSAATRVNVSTNENYSGSSNGSLVSTAQSLTAGNQLIVAITWGVDTATVSTVTDTAGNTYEPVVTHSDATGNFIALWLTRGPNGHGTNVVTVTMSAPVRYWVVNTVQYNGLEASSLAALVDLTATGDATSAATVTSDPWGPTTQANETLLAVIRNNGGGTLTPDANYTIPVQDSIGAAAIEERIVTAIQAENSTVSMSNGVLSWAMVVVALKDAGGSGGTTYTVCASGCTYTSVQSAINAADYGDSIVLTSGETFTGNFQLLDKGTPPTSTDADYITIRASALSASAGTRIVPGVHGASMAKIVGDGADSAIFTEGGARYYRLIGLDITTDGSPYVPNLVDLGNRGSAIGGYATRAETVDTHHLWIDRCFIHPAEISASALTTATTSRSAGRGVHVVAGLAIVEESWIGGFAGYFPPGDPAEGQSIDSYGVFADVGLGPLTIDNNYIEANFNNVFTGGADNYTTNTATLSSASTTEATFSGTTNLDVNDLVALLQGGVWKTVKVSNINGSVITYAGFGTSPLTATPDMPGEARWDGDRITDVNITNNTMAKLGQWTTQGFGAQWKSYIELKDGHDIDITGNLFTCVGGGCYAGAGFAFTARNQNGAQPWAKITDLYFANNRIGPGLGTYMATVLVDNEKTSGASTTWLFENNLWEHTSADSTYNYAVALDNGASYSLGTGVTFNHNTFLGRDGVTRFLSSGVAMGSPALTLTNNILYPRLYDWTCFVAPNTKATCWPGYSADTNVLIDLDGINPTGYTNSFDVNTEAAVGFTDFANGDYRLTTGSTYHNAATDKTDIGVNNWNLVPGGPSLPTTYSPADGTAFQNALNVVNCGETIELAADGREYAPPNGLFYSFEIKDRGDCSANPILIRTANLAGIAAEGARLSPGTHHAALAKIGGKGGAPVLNFQPGARGYTLIGLDITANPLDDTHFAADLISVGSNGSGPGGASTPAERLNTGWVIFDRCFIHPDQVSGTQLRSPVHWRSSGRGMNIAAQHVTVKNSDIRGFGGLYNDSDYGATTFVSADHDSATVTAVPASLQVGDLVFIKTTQADPGNASPWRLAQIDTINGTNLTYHGYMGNENPLAAGHTVVIPGEMVWGSTVDAYGVYVSVVSGDILIQNNYIEAHTMTVFTGGGWAATENEATISNASTTEATFSQVDNLQVGDYVGIAVTPYAHPVYGYPVSYQVAEVTNINGLVVSWKGVGVTGLDRTPSMPGRVTWRGYAIQNVDLLDNEIVKIAQIGGKKGHIEYKDCLTCLIEGNYIWGEWPSDTALTPRNQDGAQPWIKTSYITFRHNLLLNASRFFTIAGSDAEQTSETSHDILIEHNLAILAPSVADPIVTESIQAGAADAVTYAHNTLIEPSATNSIIFTTKLPMLSYVSRDNIYFYGAYGYNCQIEPYTPCWPSATRTKNVYIVNHCDGCTATDVQTLYPNDYAVATEAEVGFVGGGNYGLAATSPYHNAASDGGDIGVNCALLPSAAVSVCTSGVGPPAPVGRRSRARFGAGI